MGLSSSQRATWSDIACRSSMGRPARTRRSISCSSSRREGRNSWSGGSRSRITTGSPSIASSRLSKSPICCRSRSPRASSRSVGSVERMTLWTMARRSPRNMCSVRANPMPSAPWPRASAASSAVSALALTPRLRNWSAHSSRSSELGGDIRRDELDLALIDDSGRPVDGDDLTTSDIDTPGGGDARLGIDLQLGRPGDGGFAHAPSHHGSM